MRRCDVGTAAVASVLAAHLWHRAARCICGWNADPYIAGDPVEQHLDHIAETLAPLFADAWDEGRRAMWSEGIDPYAIGMPQGDNPYRAAAPDPTGA